MSRRLAVRLTRWGVVLAFLLALEFFPRVGLVGTVTLPALSEVAVRFAELAAAGEMTAHFAATASAFVLSFVLAAATGVPLGFVLWRYRTIKRVLDPYLTTYYAIPIFAFYPLLLAVLGFNILPVVAISWAWSVVAVALSTAIGLGQVRGVLGKVGRSLQLSRWKTVSRIYFPAAVPYVFSGLKLGMVYSLIGVIASEFVLSTRGLGFLVSYNYVNFRAQDMYAAMYAIIVVALVLNWILNRTERRLYARVD